MSTFIIMSALNVAPTFTVMPKFYLLNALIGVHHFGHIENGSVMSTFIVMAMFTAISKFIVRTIPRY